MLEVLTFDFWGTLYQGTYGVAPRIALIEAALDRHGQSRARAALLEAYDHAWAVVDRAWRVQHRSLPVNDWLTELLDFVGADLPDSARAGLCPMIEEVLLLEGEGPLILPGVGETVPKLARRYRLGIISDVGLTPGRVLRQLLSRDGLLPYFSALTFSDEAGATKPEPEVFLRTIEALGSVPESAAHIGDLPETDLAGARAAGMQAVLFLGVSQREDGLALADGSFENYVDLEPLLEALSLRTG